MDTSLVRSPVDLFESLTESQLAAVQHIDGPLLILAGPGSGKTRVVTHRVANLLRHGIAPQQILALTFTNKAADEMRSRLDRLAPRRPVWMGTFHRFCARLLRQHAALVGLEENFSIYDVEDSRKILNATLEETGVDLSHTTPDAIAHAISWAKNNLITPEHYQASEGRQLGKIVERVYPAYQKRMLAANAVDFDDLLQHTAVMLQENPPVRADLDSRYRYILVDEYQDTNLAQYAMVRALSRDFPNLAVTGDPDQSIYGWRGANLNNILDFEKDFPQVKVVRLEQNYRSTKCILRAADALISHNLRRKEKKLFTDNPEGAPVRLYAYPRERDEADDIAHQIAREVRAGHRRPRDFAVFYRVNALSRQIEHALKGQGVPYQIVNGLEFYQRKEIKDVLAYLHLINNPRSEAALLRVINTPTRGIGKASITRLQNHAQRHGLSLLEAARRSGIVEGLNKRGAVAIAKFVAMYDQLSELAHAAVEAIVGHVLSKSGYLEVLENSDLEEDQNRLANIKELLTAAREFDMREPGEGRLEQFLEEASLVADSDAWESESDKVTLMTMHGAKGLEFPVVFIVACEQGILPHERSRQSEEQLEEERRLLFVGLTRAKEELQLSRAEYRMFRGETRLTVPSPFLLELPRREMESSDRIGMRGATTPDFYESQLSEMAGEEGFEEEADVSFDVDDFAQVEPDQKQGRKAVPTFSQVTTAADLLAQQAGPKIAPGKFTHGMLVEHPEYGPGTIVALSGEGVKRMATVRFMKSDLEKSFRLIFSNLTPLESE
jgi:DNA helicase-2/ATP-dependent DNA helicase PcrA